MQRVGNKAHFITWCNLTREYKYNIVTFTHNQTEETWTKCHAFIKSGLGHRMEGLEASLIPGPNLKALAQKAEGASNGELEGKCAGVLLL